jgi:predicted dehydrogenase
MNYNSVCIVGYGSIGRRHHSVLSELLDRSTNYTIVDLNTATKLKDVVNIKFDILVICTPSNSHLDILKKFNKCPELIFVEKPLDASLEKINAFREQKNSFLKKIHVGSNLRYTEAYEKLKNVALRGKIFDVCAMSYLPSWRPTINWKENYSANKKMGGGVVLDFVHEPDVISSILDFPISTSTIEKRIFDNVTVDSTDTALLLWEYDNRCVTFKLSYGSREYKRYIDVIDDNGDLERVTFTKDDISRSYKRQWENILKNGPETTFSHTASLMNVLLRKKL